MQTNFYPKGPLNVPADLTTPSKSYKKHVWIASLALILFVALYLGLSTWLLYKSYKLFGNAFTGNRDQFLSFIVAVITGFLGVFMIKALFFITKRDKSNDIEITETEEPELFKFICQVADDAKAPRPHKVFLSNRVNACVFYDISIINLFFPIKKNLEIGLGLVNVLNVVEFKSILAHEFGHFAQKSMIIGRWVYIANKIAYQIVAKRDGFDAFLRGLSGVDFRVAWVGWILSIVVWSIRSVSETFFKLVLITQRALSREMEFHADLVAVSLTGSDALVHSLYKLGAADEAYDEALEFANKQLNNKKAVSDIFSIQSNHIKHMARVLNNPAYGEVPKLDMLGGSGFKVFKEQLAQAPKMWSTHPSNIDRERNAKAIYIKSEIDDRSSWLLFKDADRIRNKLTLSLYKDLKIETTPLSKQESLDLHDKDFQRSFLLPKYRGVYYNHPVSLQFKEVKDIFDLHIEPNTLISQFSLLYPECLQDQLKHLKSLDEEIEMLEGLNNKVLDANEGKINYRNREISRNELPEIIEQVKKEAKAERDKIEEHNKLCRNVYYAASKKLGNGWEEYLLSIISLVHYCEHSQKNIDVQSKYFYETLAVASKIRNISSSEMLPLLRAADDLYSVIENVFTKSASIKLSGRLLAKMDGKQFDELLEPLKLNRAIQENINSWIEVLPGWMNLALSALQTLKEATLDELLQTEESIEKAIVESNGIADNAPTPVALPESYIKFDETIKREVTQKPDFLSRFYNADGIFPTVGRLTVSAGIILFVVIFSLRVGHSNLVIYNGLPFDVVVYVADETIHVGGGESNEVTMDTYGKTEIETKTEGGEMIETFTPDISTDSKTYVYNVGQAAVLYKWTAYYSTITTTGLPQDNNSVLMGAPRWLEIEADYYFQEPPTSISLKSGASDSRDILAVYIDEPNMQASVINDEEERNKFITSHVLWESKESPNLISWLYLALDLKNFPQILEKRLSTDPGEVLFLRMQQDFYKDAEREKICEQHHQLSAKNPDDPNLYYLSCRCMKDGPEQDSAFIEGNKKWPDNYWLAYASGHCYIAREEWQKALANFKIVNEKAPGLRVAIQEEMKRISNLLNVNSDVNTINIKAPYLRYVNAVENSSESTVDGGLYSFKLLGQGKIEEAVEFSKTDSITYATVVRLAAVSDGASKEQVATALALPANKEIGQSTLIPAIALLLKNNLALDVYRESVKDLMSEKDVEFFQFIDNIKAGKIMEADQLLYKMSSEMKGKTSLLGVLILGDKAPKKWNLFASKLLFINEKPYRTKELADPRLN